MRLTPLDAVNIVISFLILMQGFVDIDYSRKYPREELLKRIMLDHEIVFQKQVHEPHRLYNVQMSLMKCDSMFTRRELFPMKRTFIESHSVGSAQFVSDYSFFQEDLCSRFQQRPPDLRLSIGNSCDDGHLDEKEVNLSLSIGMSTYKRSRISNKSSKNKIVYPSSQEIIDLEESTETGSNEFLTNVVNSHQDHSIRDSPMNSDMHQDWSSFNQGSNRQHDVKRTILLDIDLNKYQPDESSFESNEPLGQYPSSDGSCGESCSQITTSPSETPTSKQPKGQTSAKETQTKIYSIDLESLPEPSSDLTEEDTDYTVQEAALSLVSISLQQTSPSNQDSETKFGTNEIENIKENKKKPIPSSSIDSYESLVLKLDESSVDEDSATSKAFEFNEFDQKENGIKLRRGRRLKDFQKDILPTISSLSKHEIWEDIKIFEGAIRSREYKRLNKVKTCKGENSSTPVKNKRSKVSYISPKKKR